LIAEFFVPAKKEPGMNCWDCFPETSRPFTIFYFRNHKGKWGFHVMDRVFSSLTDVENWVIGSELPLPELKNLLWGFRTLSFPFLHP
jgi:hypothetical protein